jgi:hypothetical protein
MPTMLLNNEWGNANEARSYPLAADATKLDITGGFAVPDDFIIGVYLPINAGLNVQPGKFFIRSLGVFSAGFRITVAYDDGTDSPPTVATAVIPRATHQEFDTYSLSGQGDFADSVGQIVIGRLGTILKSPPGEYFFTLAGSRLEADAIQPMIQYVSGLVLVNGNNRSKRLVGDIELVAGNNMRFTVSDADTAQPKIRVDAIAGEGLNESCVCDEVSGIPIKTINGIAPAANGNFTLLGGTCVEISAITNGLKLVDICSAPCCDCPELAALTDELKFFGSEARTTQNFINRLTSEVDNMLNVILGSTLEDQGCIVCAPSI